MKENKIAGVYKITNIITGDFYIGSSNDVKRRWADCRSPSQWKLCPGMKLYQAFIKYGLDNFTFEVLEKTDNLREREQYYIEQLSPSYNNYQAKGQDAKRYKEWYKIHRDEKLAYSKDYHYTHRDEHLSKMKAYHYTHRDENLSKMKAYCKRLCLYEGKTLTLSALSYKFRRQGIPHSYMEASKYLLSK